jgi:hypothetical protein
MSVLWPTGHLDPQIHGMQRHTTYMDLDKKHIVSYLQINARDMKDTWITVPGFEIRPIQKHSTTVWMIGHMLAYMYDNLTLIMQDYLDFLKRAGWKEYNQRQKFKSCGKYLDLIDY